MTHLKVQFLRQRCTKVTADLTFDVLMKHTCVSDILTISYIMTSKIQFPNDQDSTTYNLV
jgi:hypothetical protein